MNACSSFRPLAHRLVAGSGVSWSRSFLMVSCIASSLSASISSRSCIFTVDQATGGPASETALPNNAREQTAGSHSLAAAAHCRRWASRTGARVTNEAATLLRGDEMVERRFTLVVAFAVDSAFMQGLRDLGRVDGRTIILEARYAGARSEQLPAIARDLVSHGVDVIAVWSPRAVAAVMEATSTIPIVGLSMADPVAAGVVASLARPAGNVTGIADLQKELQAKRLELLKETVAVI